MQIKILLQKKNPLMKREEILFEIDHTGKATPTRAEILGAVVKNLKKKEDLIIVDKIFSQTGKSISKAKISSYQKKDDIPVDKIEKMKRRMAKKKAAPKPEPAAPTEKKEEAKPEKPAEKKKEVEQKLEGSEPKKEEKAEKK